LYHTENTLFFHCKNEAPSIIQGVVTAKQARETLQRNVYWKMWIF